MTIIALLWLLSDSGAYTGDPPPEDDDAQTAGESDGGDRPAGPGAEPMAAPEPGDPAPGTAEDRDQD